MNGFSDSGMSENMNVVYSGCKDFARRHDFDVFSMSDYTSCENCKHFDGENRCLRKRGKGQDDI